MSTSFRTCSGTSMDDRFGGRGSYDIRKRVMLLAIGFRLTMLLDWASSHLTWLIRCRLMVTTIPRMRKMYPVMISPWAMKLMSVELRDLHLVS